MASSEPSSDDAAPRCVSPPPPLQAAQAAASSGGHDGVALQRQRLIRTSTWGCSEVDVGGGAIVLRRPHTDALHGDVVGEAPPIEPELVSFTAEVVSVDQLNADQRQCILSIAACLLPDDAFSRAVILTLGLSMQMTDEAIEVFYPLMGSFPDATPFIEDMDETELVSRGKMLLILLHHCVSRFAAYDARVRSLIRNISVLLGVSWVWFVKEEAAYVLLLHKEVSSHNAAMTPQSRGRRRSSLGRWLKVGAAAVVGTSLMVVTGGLAAPAIGAGIGALGLTAAGTFLGSAIGTAVVTGLFGATGGSLAGYKMNNRVGNLSDFEFVRMFGECSMQLTIAVTGLLDVGYSYEDVWAPIKGSELSSIVECYLLQWETQGLRNVGKGISDFAKYQLGSIVLTEGLKQTLLQGIMSAIAWPAALLSASYIIDNPWSVVVSKADQAGAELAHALITRTHGHRPVVLIGFSTGGRVVHHALLELSKYPDGVGIVQDAFIIGCPATAASSAWAKMRGVVAGRLVNAFSRSDWVLRFLYRAASAQLSICGLTSVAVDGVENFDISGIIESHGQYLSKLEQVLEEVDFSIS